MKLWLDENKSHGIYRLCADKNISLQSANAFLMALQARGLSAHTLRAYGYDLLAFYRWATVSKKEVADLIVADLLDFISDQRSQSVGIRSINRRIITIRSFYRFNTGKEFESTHGSSLAAAHYRGRGRDRSLGIHQVRAPKHRLLQIKTPELLVDPLTKEQVCHFLRTLPRYRDLSIVYLMLLCGLRSQEVLNIEVQDLCFYQNQLRVKGKGNKERMLPLPRMLSVPINNYLNLERPSDCQTSALFVILQGTKKGQPMTAAGLRSLFRHRRKEKVIANANAHRWRHTFGADMARSGVTLPILQRLMGHSDAKVTMQYINLSMADISEEFDRAIAFIQARYKKN